MIITVIQLVSSTSLLKGGRLFPVPLTLHSINFGVIFESKEAASPLFNYTSGLFQAAFPGDDRTVVCRQSESGWLIEAGVQFRDWDVSEFGAVLVSDEGLVTGILAESSTGPLEGYFVPLKQYTHTFTTVDGCHWVRFRDGSVYVRRSQHDNLVGESILFSSLDEAIDAQEKGGYIVVDTVPKFGQVPIVFPYSTPNVEDRDRYVKPSSHVEDGFVYVTGGEFLVGQPIITVSEV